MALEPQSQQESLVPTQAALAMEPEPILALDDGIRQVLDAIGDLMAFWGFQRSHGRIWSLLFLAERPLHAAELAELLDLSAGQISTSLRDLERWGVVHATRPAGHRRTSYRAETNLFQMVTRVFRERELEQIRSLAKVLLQARSHLRLSKGDPRANFRLQRLEGLLAATELGRTLVERLINGSLFPKWVTTALDRPLTAEAPPIQPSKDL